ncbi:MAG TPA: efflux RND transporter periplasmic adaptor subunit [Candidatus Paceibacterota bacterium]|nr:efflux RND transporter periplasmic adaptor subunit [Candidatus Paceibacterota bacterium]
MKDFKDKIFTKLKTSMEGHKKGIYTLIALLVIAVISVIFISRKQTVVLDVGVVERLDLAKTIMASGKVISSTDLGLSFQTGDIVSAVNYKVGDKVKKGAIIATLQNSSEQASVTKARGQLLGARARLQKVVEGASSVDIMAASDALLNAQRTQDRIVANALRKLMSDDLVLEEARTDMNPAYNPTVSGSYNGKEEGAYNFSFSGSQYDLRYRGIESGTLPIINLSQPLGTKGLTISFPVTSYAYSDEWVLRIPNKDGKNYTANLNAYNAALVTRDEVVGNLQSKLDQIKAASRPADISAAEADVVSAQGAVEAAQSDLEKTILRAPADGTITKIDTKLGDLVSPNVPVVTLQDVGNLYIEANVNESDIVGLSVGQPVSITYEALGKAAVFQGTVSEVNLGATINAGIVNYKIKASVLDVQNIKPGMTADIVVQTAKVDGALVLPSRFVHENASGKFVYLITREEDMKTEERPITTGLRGDGGYVQIMSGLSAGDKVAADLGIQ